LEWVSHVSQEVIGPDFPVRVRTIGMTYGSQSSTTEEIIDDALSMRALLLRQDADQLVGVAVACVAAAEACARALGTLAGNLAAAAGCGRDERVGPRTRATELAYAELDVLFREWLSTLTGDTDPTQAQADWHRTADTTIRRLGRQLVNRAPATAWVGRIVDNRRLTSSHADQWFRTDLRKALPLAHTEAVAS
jgi:CRISPR system Cascade subunit CasA